jgi:3-methyladenine DNA glycosylase AlkD
MRSSEILRKLKAQANPVAVAGMARFGINPRNTYGVSIPALRKMAREIGKSHLLASELWSSGVHEGRILATMIDEPSRVTSIQMDRWAKDFDSWDVCDQCCSNLFDKTKFAWKKVVEWSSSKEEFVKRAGFALIAALTVHDKEASDAQFARLLPLIERGSADERNFVKKAVNWALRQIGKRNENLNRLAIRAAKRIQTQNSKSAKWIASDALRELTSRQVQKKIRK